MIDKIKNALNSNTGIFLFGALIGLISFALFYGLAIVNPTNTSWIWQPITHDTAQHFLGWQFFRADSTGSTINGLAAPYGLSIVFMDVIPLLALFFKPFANILPADFQYFGIWGLACYMLMGGFAAVLINRLWMRICRGYAGTGHTILRCLFVAAGSLIFVLSPVVMARSFYHPALAGQWLVLLGFLIILDTPKFRKLLHLGVLWSAVMVLAVLIHPYFLPMMGALMVLSIIRYWPQTKDRMKHRVVNSALSVLVPVLACLGVFFLIGGFSLGSGAEVHDLEDKGFNLLSFFNPSGYSIIPAFSNRSSSAETMMWLGLGIIIALAAGVILWLGGYKLTGKRIGELIKGNKPCFILSLLTVVGLLVFAMGTRIDFGPITLLQYSVPDRIYELWTAFRAAAREAWPFYYAVILSAIYFISSGIRRHIKVKSHLPIYLTLALCLAAGIQTFDILNGSKTIAKAKGFQHITVQTESFAPLDLGQLADNKKHIVALDEDFRGDQSGTYVIGRTALKYNLTLNTGFFARVPDSIKEDQNTWRQKLLDQQLSTDEANDYLFFTKDDDLVNQLYNHYELIQIGDYYFVNRTINQ